MLKVFSENLVSDLNDSSIFSSTMGNKVFPILAGADNSFPLTTYRITENRGVTKDATAGSIELMFWFAKEHYDECVEFTDAMVLYLKSKYRFISSTVDISEDTMNYNGIINLEKI